MDDYLYNDKNNREIIFYEKEIKKYSNSHLFLDIKNLSKSLQQIKKDFSEKIKFDEYSDEYSVDEADYEIDNTKEYLQIALTEGASRLGENIELLPLFLESVPLSGRGVKYTDFSFLMLRDTISNLKDFIFLNDCVQEVYSSLNNISYLHLFEKCLNNSTLEDFNNHVDYFLENKYFNKKLQEDILTEIIIKFPILFERLPPNLQNNTMKRVILSQGVISNFELLVFSEQLLNKNTPEDFKYDEFEYDDYSKNININTFLYNLLKNHFNEEIEDPHFILEASKNSKTVANTLFKLINKEHDVFKNTDILKQLIIIEPDFAKNAPNCFWDDDLTVISLLKTNKAIYYRLPSKFQNDLNFHLNTQLHLCDDMYFDNIKHKVINHEKAVELIDILWNYNEKINIKTNNLNNSSDEGWRESKSFITNQNILLHFKSLCFFMTKLDGNKLSTDLAFQRRMWSAYQELENKCKNQTTNSSHYQNLENPLYLLAYHSKNEICDSTGASMLDILSSCYKSKLTDDKKDFLIQCLEEYLLYKTTLDKIDIGYFIANSITSSWNPKDSISLDEMCYFFSVIPSDKLQDIFKESTFNWSDIQKFKKSFKDLNQNMPIEDMLSKILEIQMLNDTQQTNQIKGKVLKF